MDRLFYKIDQSVCPICNKNSLILITRHGECINYLEMLDSNYERPNSILDFLNTKEIFKLKCRSCNSEFVINWQYGLPIALYSDTNYDRFMNLYSQNKIYDFTHI